MVFLLVENTNEIRDIYKKRNDWIVEYYRPDIEEYFEQCQKKTTCNSTYKKLQFSR
jgi:hypothetical protein